MPGSFLRERGAVLQPLGKFSFILSEAGADEVVGAGEAEGAHLVHGFVGGPTLFGHAVGRYHHTGAVVSQTAMHKDFFAFVVVHYLQKFGEYFIVRPGTAQGIATYFIPSF